MMTGTGKYFKGQLRSGGKNSLYSWLNSCHRLLPFPFLFLAEKLPWAEFTTLLAWEANLCLSSSCQSLTTETASFISFCSFSSCRDEWKDKSVSCDRTQAAVCCTHCPPSLWVLNVGCYCPTDPPESGAILLNGCKALRFGGSMCSTVPTNAYVACFSLLLLWLLSWVLKEWSRHLWTGLSGKWNCRRFTFTLHFVLLWIWNMHSLLVSRQDWCREVKEWVGS